MISQSTGTGPGIAVVTGAAGGMGAAIARKLHADGRRVLLADIDTAGVEALAAELSPDGSTARGLELDVSRKVGFEEALATCRQIWGIPTIVVNNAAVTQAADLMNLAEADFTSVLTTNVNSIFFGCQVFGAAMADQGFGRIVNMASLAGQNGGTATGGHYAASKGAILTTTKVFARELAGRGVTVNAISPGPHDLPVVRATVPPDRLAGIVAGIPVGRLGSPSFVADMVGLLTSDDAYFVTGACWDVNGGLYLR
ncbi:MULTISPECIES: SDR family NAD(P)-dependent oxidoreductase [Rhodococcus]|uniref:3-oxoacyl-[acyl-carrier protein] reductase n=1 Tax=Rhodococcus aetherivorans TaxID=191292 RepID=A0AA46SB05_9NOCA|nr:MULTISPECIES: SDR family oxidoreductase [Rhodococcus]ETT23767.1 3-oxoacyl-(acyl-carrier-protein) reductase [Rhodococcus rhodochrous ATCC 21198]NCL75117.1 3-oxoacyl-[acyl-carrier-protein] reductase FabG [Rhodococcus sp. YH1]MDV6296383.1 SDR family oxidoreductase [Rhodococcus aetherivorans]NCL78854.1 3-oxoacyl-[acyl-carrier-protein] reductase FabG [Rhodococcus sp. YH1]NGP28857.1 SDR family oxidoreductase [Rhodococcus aetherivorans]